MFEKQTIKEEDKKAEEIRKWEERVGSSLEILWDTHENNQERIDIIKEKIKYMVDTLLDKNNSLMSDLDACLALEDKNQFVQGVMKAFKPLRDIQFDEPERYEKALAQAFVETSNFTKINQLLCYDIDGTTMHIHVIPNETTPTPRKLFLLKEGLKGLAEVVRDNEEIKTISGTSWIVAKNPRLLEKLGFTIAGDISQQERERFFTGEDRPVYKATISRQELMSRYL